KHVASGVELHAGPVVREITQWQVARVDRVYVEVHDERPGNRGQRRRGLPGYSGRVGSQLMVGDGAQPRPGRQNARVEAVRVGLVVTEHDQVIVVEDR